MNYTANIKIKKDKNIVKAFMPEMKHSKNSRAWYKIITLKKHIKFQIYAHDVVALRATMNTILRLLSVYEEGKHGNI